MDLNGRYPLIAKSLNGFVDSLFIEGSIFHFYLNHYRIARFMCYKHTERIPILGIRFFVWWAYISGSTMFSVSVRRYFYETISE